MIDQKQKLLLTEDEVSRIFNISKHTLRSDRFKGSGLPYIKIERRVRYKVSDIEKYLDANTVGGHRYD